MYTLLKIKRLTFSITLCLSLYAASTYALNSPDSQIKQTVKPFSAFVVDSTKSNLSSLDSPSLRVSPLYNLTDTKANASTMAPDQVILEANPLKTGIYGDNSSNIIANEAVNMIYRQNLTDNITSNITSADIPDHLTPYQRDSFNSCNQCCGQGQGAVLAANVCGMPQPADFQSCCGGGGDCCNSCCCEQGYYPEEGGGGGGGGYGGGGGGGGYGDFGGGGGGGGGGFGGGGGEFQSQPQQQKQQQQQQQQQSITVIVNGTSVSVPEPSTWMILGGLLACIAVIKCRRKAKA